MLPRARLLTQAVRGLSAGLGCRLSAHWELFGQANMFTAGGAGAGYLQSADFSAGLSAIYLCMGR